MQANFIFEQLKNTHCVDVMPLQNPQSYSWSEPYQAYKEGMFHGPIFQSLPLIAGWDLTGIDGKLSNVSLNGFFVERQKPNFVLNPVLLDALGQLTAFWIAEQIGTDFNSFPSSIECIEFYTPLLEKRDDLYLSGRLENQQIFDGNMNAMPSWNFQCIDVSGQIHLRVKGLKSVFFPVPHEFYQCRYNPYGSFLGSPTQDENGNFVWSMQSLQKDFTAQSNAIFMRMLAHIYLSANERGLWKQLAHAAIEQKRNWLFTYISIKEAARYYIYTQTNRLLYASDIEVNYQNDQYNVYGYWSHEESFIFPEFFTSLFVQGEQIFVKPINPYQFVDLAA
jgi:hypothetical protein